MTSRLSVVCALALVSAADPAAQPLATLVSPNTGPRTYFGVSAAAVGDVTGDGASDVLVGAPRETVGGFAEAGRAYVYSGATGALVRTLTSPNAQRFGAFGAAAAAVGDLTGDGVPDLLIGAGSEGGPPVVGGAAYIFDGATGALVRTLTSPAPVAIGAFGASVASAGDVTADGLADVLVGATGEAAGAVLGAGRAHLFDGATGALVRTLVSPEAMPSGYFGIAAAGVGDVTGDGVPDVLVGAYTEGDDSNDTGRAHLFNGATGALVRTLVSPHPQAQGSFGYTLSGAGDVTGDGVPDILVGANTENVPGASEAGRAYVFDGATRAVARTLVSPNAQSGGSFGGAVTRAGDVTGDGISDLLVGASFEGAGVLASGAAYVFDGATGVAVRTLRSPNPETGGNFGNHVASLGDVTGDGAPDLLMTAPSESSQAGRAYLFRGAAATAVSESVPSAAAVVVAPNPTRGMTSIRAVLAEPTRVAVELYDALGRRVLAVDLGLQGPGPLQASLDLSGLPPGVYTVRVGGLAGTVSRNVTVF